MTAVTAGLSSVNPSQHDIPASGGAISASCNRPSLRLPWQSKSYSRNFRTYSDAGVGSRGTSTMLPRARAGIPAESPELRRFPVPDVLCVNRCTRIHARLSPGKRISMRTKLAIDVARTFATVLGSLLVLSLLVPARASAQVDVTATAGTLNASYTTLKGAFDAINLGTHQGTIGIGLSGSTTETAPAVLNASGSGGASYTTITINPTGGAARTISGAIAAGSPLIDFNGADNVTIDGLNTGGNSLTIANTTVSATSGTATIRFIGGATNNTITNSNIQGSGTMSVATNGANIFFSTDAVTANGNDNNTISNNNIGPAGANLPTKGILCNGSTTTAAIGNSGIIINNNNIFDYFGAAVTSAGVATNAGCNTWSITNNRFYQTGTRTWTTGALHNAILLSNT